MIPIIQSVLAMDTKGADIEKLSAQLKAVGERRTSLIAFYASGDITRDEFITAKAKCEDEISELKSVAQSIGEQGLIAEITEAVQGLVDGMADSDDFYQGVLDKMVVNDKGHIDVYLKALPFKWSYMDVECAKCP